MTTKATLNILLYLVLGIFVTSVESTLWTQMIEKTHDWSSDYSQQLKQQFLSITKSQNISIECNASIWQTVNGIQNLEVWAIDMINSWGSFPPKGVRVGTSTDLGSYDQCLAIEPNIIIDKPQYCLIDVRPPLPTSMKVHHNLFHRIDVLPKDFDNKFKQNVFTNYSQFASFFYWVSLRTGICTPSKCSQNDINLLAEGFAESYGLELKAIRCETIPTKTTITPIQVIAILFVMIILVLSLMATILEIYSSKQQNIKGLEKIINLFSIKQNCKLLLSAKRSETLHCIHGIRVLSIIWVIFCHSVQWMNYQLFARAFSVKTIFSGIDIQMALNGTFSVETFLFISGMLTSYMTFDYTKGKLSKFNIRGFIVARYMRLMPQAMIFVLLTFLINLGGWASGPIWKETIDPEIDNCSNNWWFNLLFIQNWLTLSKVCGVHTWYIAADMQLHCLSLLFIVPLLYSDKIGLWLTGSGIILFYFSSIIISYSLNLPPGVSFSRMDEHFWANYMNLYYFKPWSHTTVFFIGFILGIIIYKNKFIQFSKINRYIFSALIIFGLFFSLMDTYYWNIGKDFNRLTAALVLGTSHLIWGLSLFGLIWMCISGNGGIINSFLSAHIFTPFSRLTYSAYLVHPWVIWVYIGTRRERIDINVRDIIYIFLHNLVLAYLVAFVFALLIEGPILRFQKLFSKQIETDSELKTKTNGIKTVNNNDIGLP